MLNLNKNLKINPNLSLFRIISDFIVDYYNFFGDSRQFFIENKLKMALVQNSHQSQKLYNNIIFNFKNINE